MSDDEGGFEFCQGIEMGAGVNAGEASTLQRVTAAGVACQNCGSKNLGVLEETMLFCKQCHTEIVDHALNAQLEYFAVAPKAR
jgi:hypothetical protein